MSARTKLRKQDCHSCSFSFPVNRSQCPSCLCFNFSTRIVTDTENDNTILLSDVDETRLVRVSTGPWDPCWGEDRDAKGKVIAAGAVNTSVTLVGGVPGAGKSTLSLQFAEHILSTTKGEVLYVGEEECKEEIRARAKRLKLKHMNRIRLIPMGVDADLGLIIANRKPKAMIYDSLSTIIPDPEEAVEFCKRLKTYSVQLHAPAILIDHVTKDEEFAGFMTKQHAVDTTLMFTVHEDQVREIKTVKNRNGPSGISVFLNMTEHGLVLRDPSEDDDEDEDADE